MKGLRYVVWLGVLAVGEAVASQHVVPYIPAASDEVRQGFVRVIHHGDVEGTIDVWAIDEAGTSHGPVVLSIGGRQTVHFNSRDVEAGNARKGLASGVGTGEGDWRLELRSELDVEVLGYVRTRDGLLTAMQELAPDAAAGQQVVFFNPGSNRNQVSILRVTNPGTEPAGVRVRGTDDAGTTPGTEVSFTLAGGATRALTAQELESGNAPGLTGALGNGSGKWRLTVSSDTPIRTMSLLSSPTGHLTNLSSAMPAPPDVCGERVWRVPLFPSSSHPFRQGFLRLVNESEETASVELRAFDDTGRVYGPLTLDVGARQAVHVNSDDLEMGNAAKDLQGLGSGTGDWHLELRAASEVETLAYVRTNDGFVTSMHDLAPTAVGGHQRVAVLNPGHNVNQVGQLRLVNPGDRNAFVNIQGFDDDGEPGAAIVHLSVPPRAARTVTSVDLETGDAEGAAGALGDGRGKWRLSVESGQPIDVLSLIESPTGHLTNLSLATRRAEFDDSPKPDLVVEWIEFDENQALSFGLANGGRAALESRYEQVGQVPPNVGEVRVFVDGALLRTYRLGDLLDQSFRTPGQEQVISTDLRLAGEDRRIAVVVDANNEIVESNEFHNSLTHTATLPAIDGPDLVIADLSVGTAQQLLVEVENAGNEASTKVSGWARVYQDDTLLQRTKVTMEALAPNRTATVAFDRPIRIRRLSRIRVTLEMDAAADADNTNGTMEASLPRTAALSALEEVLEDPAISASIKWEDADGVRDYESWSGEERAELERAFLTLGGRDAHSLLRDPPVRPEDGPPLSNADAWNIYLNHVAQSLWVEVHGVVPWSLRNLPEEQLKYILGLEWEGLNYSRPRSRYGEFGWNVELSPRVSFDFLSNLGLLRSSQLETVHALVDWMRGYLLHSSGGDTPEALYNYHGWRVDKVLYAPERQRHLSRGCWGTSNLFGVVLANVNIPAYRGHLTLTGGPGVDHTHARPVFPSICRSMPHGDDVYNSRLRPSGSVVPSSRIMYSLAEMQERFTAPDLECSSECNTTGTQASVNSARDVLQHAFEYKADSLLEPDRDRLVETLTGVDWFAQPLFDEETREAMADGLEDRLRAIGGGDLEAGRAIVRQRRLDYFCRQTNGTGPWYCSSRD